MKFKMKTFVKTQIIIAFALIAVAFAPNVYAANLDITCNPDDGSTSCVVLPSNTAALFDPADVPNEGEYPLSDMKPGDTVNRKIFVHNDGERECFFTISSATVTMDTKNFSGVLETEIRDGAVTTGFVPFSVLFANTPLYVGSIPGGASKTFDWNVNFPFSAGNEYQLAQMIFNFTWNFNCGDAPTTPKLYIAKTNDSYPDVETPGVTVRFTLVVHTDDHPVNDVIVVDLPADGFTYVPGSWTANSNLRSDLKALSITPEPTYHSPGTWQLGDMAANEVVTLTYDAVTDSSAAEGLYKDLAWTKGLSEEGDTVVGNEESAYFVGTLVRLALEPDTPSVEVEVKTDKKEITEEVLGSSTQILPATGARTKWFVLVVGLFILGAYLIFVGFRLKKSLSAIFLIVLAGSLFVGGKVYAAFPNLSVKLFEPEAINTSATLNLNFVALDILNTPITVKCFKKAPSDVSFVQYGADIVLAAGGNSGVCVADASILPDDGSYDFYVSATANSETVDSSLVTVVYDSDLPGKPKYIEKNKKSSCVYEIEFRTADDGGDTDKVEVYRSDEKEFDANASTRIETITVDSDTKITFDDTKPDCGKTYYYAVRAFDDAGNASSVRTEVIEETKTSTKTTTGEETVTTTEGAATGAIVVTESGVLPEPGATGVGGGEEPEEGEVAGVETTQTPETSETLGIKDVVRNNLGWGLLGLVIAVIFIALYGKYKKRKTY